jgi:L-ribulose-5-phosphate 4-epimerase
LVVIKPSGVPYEVMKASDMVVVELDTGRVAEGSLRPSSDLSTHLVLYRAFSVIGGVVHTHAPAATAWAQAQREIVCFGTTHADYFYGTIPVTATLTDEEIEGDYELNTGHAIVRRFEGMDPASMPAVLVAGHGPFTWGKDVADAAHNAVLLEQVAKMALDTLTLNPAADPIPTAQLDKHFLRKHGPRASYGQAR